MTKLKKSKKRTKKRFSFSALAAETSFADFCASIEKKWIPLSWYKWGLDFESLFDREDFFCQLQSTKDQPVEKPLLDQHIQRLENEYQTDLKSVMELLAVVNGVGLLADSFEGEQFAKAISSLFEKAFTDDRDMLYENPVAHQIIYGEVPLTIGLRFPGLEQAPEFLEVAKRNLALGLEELLDSDGLPNARYVSDSGLLFSVWTRCQKICDLANMECFDLDTQTQYEYLVRQMMRLIRKDGSLVFSDDRVDLKKVIQEALTCYHDESDALLAQVIFSKPKKGKSKKLSLNSLPEASENSEWGELAVLQTEWTPKSPRLTVNYRNRKIVAELSAGGVLLSGEITSEFVIDQEPVTVETDWEVVCWHSDQDGDFLELEAKLSDGSKWQKHFLLARNEQFLLSGDVILGDLPRPIEFSSRWPLHEGAGFGLARETNEFFLTRKSKTAAAVIPVSMPEWRSERSNSVVNITDSRLTCQTNVVAENVYCPFFIDLDPKRCRKPLTWRQLTVAEKLEILPRSDASAYRIQVGDQQWLIYRSLKRAQSRTVFGQNLNVEFYAGSFESDGTCSEIISVS